MPKPPILIVTRRTRPDDLDELPAAGLIALHNVRLDPADLAWFTSGHSMITLDKYTHSKLPVPRLTGPNAFLFSKRQEQLIHTTTKQQTITKQLFCADIIGNHTVILYPLNSRPVNYLSLTNQPSNNSVLDKDNQA